MRKQGNIQQKRKADAGERAVVRCNGNHQKSEDTRRKEQQKSSGGVADTKGEELKGR